MDDDVDDECFICFEHIKEELFFCCLCVNNSKSKKLTCCNKVVHLECYNKWYENNINCPWCQTIKKSKYFL